MPARAGFAFLVPTTRHHPRDRSPDAGANTPWYVTKCRRGGGTSAHRRSISTAFVIPTAVVPSRQRCFSVYPIRPPASSTSRDSATAGRAA